MSDDFFEFQDSSLSKDQADRLINPVMYCDNDQQYDICVISDKYLTIKEISLLKNLINKKNDNSTTLNFLFLFPFKFMPNEKELSKQISNFYADNTIDLTKYIKPNSKIVTMGRAINAITFDTDVEIEAFYDIVFNDQYFYSNKLKSYVFPINKWESFIGQDNWNNYFAFLQFKNVINFNAKQKRNQLINLVDLKTVEETDKFLYDNMNQTEVAWDIETSGFNFMGEKVICITMSFDGLTSYFLDWKNIDVNLLNKFFENKYQIGANLKFDCKFLLYNKITNVKIDFDVINCGHVLNEMRSNSLKTLAWIYTDFGGYEYKLDNYKRKYKKINYSQIPHNILFPYATMDSIVTYQVYKKQKEHLKLVDRLAFEENCRWNLSRYYYEIVIPSLNLFTEVEYRGTYINWDKVKEAGEILSNRILDIKKQLAESFNVSINSINWDSNEQLGDLLQKNNWECYGISKKGKYLVNDETLKEWSKEGHKEADLIIQLHALNTLNGTFVGDEKENTGYWQYKFLDNKVHPNFAVMLADSGRNKCSNPNLQNIPKHGDDAKLIRSYFCPPSEDYYILSLDFSGFQLRIGAALSGDFEMKKAFTELGGDLHSVSAASILLNNKITIEEFIARKKEKEFKEMRFKAKSINFSLEFNTAGISFAEETLEKEWPFEEIEKYIIENNITNKPYDLHKNDIAKKRNLDLRFCKYWAVANDIKKKFFEKYCGLKKWIDDSIDFAENYGYVKSSFGCIRRLPQLLYKGDREFDTGIIKNLQNISVNSPVQNFEISEAQLALIEANQFIKDNNLKSMIFSATHDSMDLYCYKSELKIIISKFKEIVERDLPENQGIPMEIEWDIAEYPNEFWGFGKELKFKDL